ncbi:ribonuclease P protein component [Marinococcus luteus]|uniref:Ribonuclease P protein component n=1 Tax=Marinococcus luteus TaxID=1122204 RepID=A0A1H2W8K1_9BACI|nr:ribonuclease P protein component [Marinococcus luteus]SDW76786.1 ribonuclease P protein component [Marinococcus luteus]
MKKHNRLKKNHEFSYIFAHGTSFANRQFVLYTLKKEEQVHYRAGLTVSKRMGNAVMRNRIKRYLREALSELEPRIPGGYDLIVIARKPVADMDYHETKKSLTHVFKKAGLLNSGKTKPKR